MTTALAWIAAVGGVLATVGTWLGPVRARWELRAEQLRNSQARRENELHRKRFGDVWNWWRDQPEDSRVDAIHWYSEWTGVVRPRRAGIDNGPMTPGLHNGNEDGAYQDYVQFLEAVYQP